VARSSTPPAGLFQLRNKTMVDVEMPLNADIVQRP